MILKLAFSASDVLDAPLAHQAFVTPQINAISQNLQTDGFETLAAGLHQAPLSSTPYLLNDVSRHLGPQPVSLGARSRPSIRPDTRSVHPL